MILTTCRELLETIGLVESYSVCCVTLQLRGLARRWWRIYAGFVLVGSSLVTWETFSRAFYDHFYPWSVREESLPKFDSFKQGKMTIIKYKIHFCQLATHATTIILYETKKICRFVRGKNYSIRQSVFWVASAEFCL